MAHAEVDLIPDDRVAAWLAALDQRHLHDLTPSEVARALRALSSCYVERREKLARGGALESAGKRAAFALFYAPLHFFVLREIVRALPEAASGIREILEIGCGTGASGAAWSIACAGAKVTGFDRHPWAVAEANWTYPRLGVPGRASRGDLSSLQIRGAAGHGVLAAYTVNELPEAVRATLLIRLLAARERGSRILIVEPIARRVSGWWSGWEREFVAAGGRSDEWRFPAHLPERQRALGRAAGLDPRELTARSLWL
jgi:hypothetical protein